MVIVHRNISFLLFMLRAMQVIIRKADKKTLENQIQDTEFYRCVNFKK